MTRKLLPLAVGLALSEAAFAQTEPVSNPQQPPPVDATVPVTYVGSNLRVSLGVDDDGDVLGEILAILGKTDDHAWLGELWLGQGGAGGVQVDYHWLHGSADDAGSASIWKVFGAGDQNEWKDRKATLGLGWEREDFTIDGYYSHSTSGSRLTNATTSTVTTELTGTDDAGPYTQTQTVDTLTKFYEHPYENGVGVRLGKYFDDPLIRLRGGVDYEKGHYSSDQFTLSLGIDKYFANTGFSLSLEGESLHKSGDFETDKNDTRGWLLLRYDFGQSFRAREPYKMVQVEKQVPDTSAPPPPAPQVMRNDVRLDGDAFFDFDHSNLRPDAVAALDELIAKLKSSARVSRVTVVGHTCNIGPDAYNQKLSERRAAAVKAYLEAHGVAADEVEARGEGERNPKYPNDTRESRKKNRRVDIEFLTIEETTAPPPPPPPATKSVVEWVKEPVAAPPAWIERALRNPAEHKRTVDVYKFEKSTSTTTVGPKQHQPVAVDDSAIVPENSTDNAIDVLANDSDPDGDPLTITAVSAAAHGTAAAGGSGVVYTPAADYRGEDSFTYTIGDGRGGSATATVHVTVGSPNQPPIAGTLSVRVLKGSAIDIPVLQAASDPDGDPLTVVSVNHTGPLTINVVSINPDNTVRYQSVHGMFGQDYFEYTVSDGHGGAATGTISVYVFEAPPPPP
ncbi:MAG TPA: Ig-like domain-containing protein [Rhodanobacteraceae bacterium]|nr:Ig-like domain-containing protein [Rhodanobacteraceae bacterium]